MNRCTAVPTADEHAQLVGAAVAGRDRVDERADVLVGRLGPGQRQVAAQAVVLVLALEHERQGRDPLVVALVIDGVEEVGHAAVVAELDVRLVLLVDELDDQPLVEVGLDLEPLGDQRGVVVEVLEDVGVGRERDAGARCRATARRFSTGPCGLPRRYRWIYVWPSRRTSAVRLLLRALTTLAPTPCSPPATL